MDLPVFEIAAQLRALMIAPDRKVLTLEELVRLRNSLRTEGKRFVLTNGCFDLLHRGHISYLFESARQGDFLAVAVNSDESVRALKGDGRPVNSEQDRAYLIAAIGCVGASMIFEGPRLAREIRALSPDVYTKAGDYSIDALESTEREALIEVGAKILFMPFEKGVSTTGILQRIGSSKSEIHGR